MVRTWLRTRLPHPARQLARGTVLAAARLVYRGSGVVCPCCGSEFRSFAPFHGRREQCPGCGSLSRHRLLIRHLTDIHTDDGAAVVLHIAPEPAVALNLRRRLDLDYLSVDLDSRYADLKADITSLPLDGSSIDWIICLHVLEHIENDRAAIAELHRVLRPGGVAILQVPIFGEATVEDPSVTTPAGRLAAFGQHDHVRICGTDYINRIRDQGFTVSLEDWAEALSATERARIGVDVGEPFFVCRRLQF